MSPEFTYSQRPFSRCISNEEYDQAVGRTPSPVVQAAIEILSQHDPAMKEFHIASIFHDFPFDHGNATDAPVSSCTHGETGHMCNGTYKTFAAEHCPYCQRKPYHPNGVCGDSTCGICKY